MDTLFDIPAQARSTTHGCTGPGCTFCEWLDGRAAKARAVDAVRFDPRWRHEANQWRVEHVGDTVTADDLIAAIGLPDGSPNQVGALFRQWATMSVVRQAGTESSRRDTNHARRIIRWQVTA
jgi:hypothetical protein